MQNNTWKESISQIPESSDLEKKKENIAEGNNIDIETKLRKALHFIKLSKASKIADELNSLKTILATKASVSETEILRKNLNTCKKIVLANEKEIKKKIDNLQELMESKLKEIEDLTKKLERSKTEQKKIEDQSRKICKLLEQELTVSNQKIERVLELHNTLKEQFNEFKKTEKLKKELEESKNKIAILQEALEKKEKNKGSTMERTITKTTIKIFSRC